VRYKSPEVMGNWIRDRMWECFGDRTGGKMVVQSTGVSGVVRPQVYRVTGVVGEPSETLACFQVVGWTDSKDWESGWRRSWRCASLSAAHGGCGTVRTVTMTHSVCFLSKCVHEGFGSAIDLRCTQR
jgi:hypothetical protein